jgi:type IV pilus assembly protein PilE
MKRSSSGVTLVELMIVVGVVGILAAIAYPNYRQYVLRANRTDARATLMQVSQGLEKCFTRFMRYDSVTAGDCPTADAVLGAGTASERRLYTVTATIPRVAGRPSFLLTAMPQGSQVADTLCGNFTLDETGLRGVSGTAGRDACW